MGRRISTASGSERRYRQRPLTTARGTDTVSILRNNLVSRAFNRREIMSISASLLPEFDQEMANTRKALERIPDDKLAWKRHEKSWDMGGLATHLANLPNWAGYTIKRDSLDLAPPGSEPLKVEQKNSRQEILEDFDKNV